MSYTLKDMKRIVPVFAIVLGLSASAADAQAPVEQRIPVYEGASSSGRTPQVLPPGGPGGGSSGVAVSPVADAQARLDALEEEMRQLRGQVEQQGYTIDQLRRQLEQSRAAAPVPQAQPQAMAQPAPVAGGAAVTGAAPLAAPQPLTGNSTSPAAPSTAATLPGSAATDSYSQSFALLQQGNYPAAEQGFQSFLQAKPTDPLAGNAQYWLAETFYVRKDYARAAQEFLKGYQTYPTGSKAPDSLLKLALSLSSLGQKDQACRTLTQLHSDYPSLSRTLGDRATQERQRLACP